MATGHIMDCAALHGHQGRCYDRCKQFRESMYRVVGEIVVERMVAQAARLRDLDPAALRAPGGK